MTLEELNRLSEADARAELLRCCGAARWTDAMVASRPFSDRQALEAAAARLWWGLAEADWLEAFSHHPRIGERAQGWAAAEQSGTSGAKAVVLAALQAENEAYEARYGHVYLVCATGKTAEEMLAILRLRMGNAPADELRVAAGEQEKITRLRLARLLS